MFNRNPDLIVGRTAHNRSAAKTFDGPSGPFRVQFNPYEIANSFYSRWDNSRKLRWPAA